jgi:hypothetical protein
MKPLLTLIVVVFSMTTPAFAEFPYGEHPQQHTEYDWESGNRYQIEHHNNFIEQDTHIKGYNFNTGSQWETTIDRDGDMRGRDADGNSWKYDERSGFYQNYGTGKTCIGKGAARNCF